ncbi:MAG: iron-sulfur cluster assembly accessory protein [Micavibrio aeruginosavorus]|uniref:Iron-sulfur cluster assembly accessory protein n=1 Tax=Micavibrio aeruginosavorus TaxID=349221 RepID=A0A2W5FM85_9BACT|nr:MAG: iron-sulfur cluster assembly accessory protein [Micavibrio aeruginosavorus]
MPELIITPAAITRVHKMREIKGNPLLNLRLTVEGGGCSGFQYIFSWDDKIAEDDKIFDQAIVSDEISLPLLEGSTLDYVINMMGEDFKVTNPNAKSGCGCGTSFAV